MKFAKIKTLFRQFGTLNAIRYLYAEINRKIYDPFKITSYSQTGEDRIIEHLLGESGFYVDVGCNHPQYYSNTFSLYKKGWTGITIDACPELIKQHQKLRKRDRSICAVISDKEQEVIFTDFEDSLVSSLDAEHVSEWMKSRKIKEQRVVKTISLNSILDTCKVPSNFDLLNIDVEGHDYEVLTSLDLNIYRPKLIVIEMHGFDLTNPSSSKIYEYLTVNNYKLIGYATMNGYFAEVPIEEGDISLC